MRKSSQAVTRYCLTSHLNHCAASLSARTRPNRYSEQNRPEGGIRTTFKPQCFERQSSDRPDPRSTNPQQESNARMTRTYIYPGWAAPPPRGEKGTKIPCGVIKLTCLDRLASTDRNPILPAGTLPLALAHGKHTATATQETRTSPSLSLPYPLCLQSARIRPSPALSATYQQPAAGRKPVRRPDPTLPYLTFGTWHCEDEHDTRRA